MTTNFPSRKEQEEVCKLLSTGDATRIIPRSASPTDKLKYIVCEKILEFKLEKKLSAKEFAEKLGLSEELTSKITRYHISKFTLDEVTDYLNRLYPILKLRLRVWEKP
jgi:predicted XRE-type DNA-binding protein